MPVGSTPTSVTIDPVVQRQRRLGDNQESDGSSPSGITGSKTHWSVGAEAARRRGKAEDWVQFPDGPLLKTWAARPTGRCLACNQEIGVRFPGRSTDIWKVAGYGSPGRFAKPCGFTAMWVQIPRLPLVWLDGETEIMLRF